MTSTGPKNKLFCQIRKKWVADKPEERVRQATLTYLIEKLDYPREIISVEVALQELPHISGRETVPPRRIDILCYSTPLAPLLLIECKAVALADSMLAQMMGYNHYVGASYVAITNGFESWTAWIDKKENNYQLFKGLPIYGSAM